MGNMTGSKVGDNVKIDYITEDDIVYVQRDNEVLAKYIAEAMNRNKNQIILVHKSRSYNLVCFYTADACPHDNFYIVGIPKRKCLGYKTNKLQHDVVLIYDDYYCKLTEFNGYVYLCHYTVYQATTGVSISKEQFERYCIKSYFHHFIKVNIEDYYKYSIPLNLMDFKQVYDLKDDYIENVLDYAKEYVYNKNSMSWEFIKDVK